MRNLILTGGIFHPFNESSRALQKILMKEGIESEITEDIEFGLKKIGEGDFNLLTVYALRWSMKNGSKYKPYRDQWEYNISAAGQKNIRKFLEKGVEFSDYILLQSVLINGKIGYPFLAANGFGENLAIFLLGLLILELKLQNIQLQTIYPHLILRMKFSLT